MSTSCFDAEDGVFKVLVNQEDQYSLWPEWKAIPGGWRDTGVQGDKQSCLAHVDQVWQDMRPQSLRTWMDGLSTASGAGKGGAGSSAAS